MITGDQFLLVVIFGPVQFWFGFLERHIDVFLIQIRNIAEPCFGGRGNIFYPFNLHQGALIGPPQWSPDHFENAALQVQHLHSQLKIHIGNLTDSQSRKTNGPKTISATINIQAKTGLNQDI